ncbi:MAG: hypothetical protein IKI58_05970 [Oscillospiraceae bacterium]|nr:hypothetical protein [Oscillospiraceae bacterium]
MKMRHIAAAAAACCICAASAAVPVGALRDEDERSFGTGWEWEKPYSDKAISYIDDYEEEFQDNKLVYNLYDVDGNGTPELFVGVIGTKDTLEVDIYTYSNHSVVKVNPDTIFANIIDSCNGIGQFLATESTGGYGLPASFEYTVYQLNGTQLTQMKVSETEPTGEYAKRDTILDGNSEYLGGLIGADADIYWGEAVSKAMKRSRIQSPSLSAPVMDANALDYRIVVYEADWYDGGTVDFAWQEVPGADGYEVLVHWVGEEDPDISNDNYEDYYMKSVTDTHYEEDYGLYEYPFVTSISAMVRAYKNSANGRIYGDWSSEKVFDYEKTKVKIVTVDTNGTLITPDAFIVGTHIISEDEVDALNPEGMNDEYYAGLKEEWRENGQLNAVIQNLTTVSATKAGYTAASVTVSPNTTGLVKIVMTPVSETDNNQNNTDNNQNNQNTNNTNNTSNQTNNTAADAPKTGDAGTGAALAVLLTAAGAAFLAQKKRR